MNENPLRMNDGEFADLLVRYGMAELEERWRLGIPADAVRVARPGREPYYVRPAD